MFSTFSVRIRCRVLLAATVVLPAMLMALPVRAADGDRPPNIVLIISDDHGWTDYSFMRHPAIKTPNIDKLAKESATFPRGYVAAPLCSPSLTSILTGLHPHQHKVVGNDPALKQGAEGAKQRERLIANVDKLPSLPRLLGEKGYVSLQTGKWWLGGYERGGFTQGMTKGFPNPGGRHGDEGLKIGREGLKPIFDFIDTAKRDGKPFFVWYAPMMPHTPHNPPDRLLNKYLKDTRQKADAAYFAMCEWFDETCGELLSHLDKNGLRDNTLVVYVADNGWKQEKDSPHHDGKRTPYEGGVRTPILLRWQGKIKPVMSFTPVMSIDLAPTILAACGLQPGKELQGVNLLQLLDGKVEREAVFGAAYEHDVMDLDDPAKSLLQRWTIERGRWKLIATPEGRQELYNVEIDLFELNDLVGDHPDVVKRLAARLDAWWKLKP